MEGATRTAAAVGGEAGLGETVGVEAGSGGGRGGGGGDGESAAGPAAEASGLGGEASDSDSGTTMTAGSLVKGQNIARA